MVWAVYKAAENITFKAYFGNYNILKKFIKMSLSLKQILITNLAFVSGPGNPVTNKDADQFLGNSEEKNSSFQIKFDVCKRENGQLFNMQQYATFHDPNI